MRSAETEVQHRSLVGYRLRFPAELPAPSVEAFLTGWTGSLPPWWKRAVFGVPFLICEVEASASGIEHRLLVPASWSHTIDRLLAAHLPNVRWSRIEVPAPEATVGAEFRLSTGQRPLDADVAGTTARLLSSIQPLGNGERVVVQLVLGPAAPVQPARLATGELGSGWLTTDDGLHVTSEAVAALKAKRSRPLLLAVVRIGVAAERPRAISLLRHVESAWHGLRAPGVHLRRRYLGTAGVARRVRGRYTPVFGWPNVLNVAEAAALVGFPVELTAMQGLELSGTRLLPVPGPVPSTGTVVGIGTFPSTERPVALGLPARLHHVHVVGPTGSGKSVFLSRIALADLEDRQRSLVVVDPKDGGLVDLILERLPANRLHDVIVVDPTDARPVGFDPLASTPETRELVVDRVVAIMGAIWKSSWGPRSSDIVRHALLTLTQVPGMTICEAPALLSDPRFRDRILRQVDDPIGTAAFWAWFNGLSDAERNSVVAPPLNKLRAFTTRTAVRHMLGQSKPAIDFGRVVNGGGVLLVRLPSGSLGDETASLLGSLITTQLWQAITARASIPPDERRPAMVLLDEVQMLLRLPSMAIEDMLTQARGYRVGTTLAHQHLQQLPGELRQAAMANTRSKIVFACSRDDAGVFAREFGVGLKPEDLMNLDAYEAIATVFAEGRSQQPATIRTLASDPPVRDAEVVRAQSRRRYGAGRDDIEQALRARVEPPKPATAPRVGRKRKGQP